ncbi:MAG TPA: protein phosphatase CheZ, partial [Massilia sp.]|nr:protein phosphatase CheZ [Massilia sp.]
MRGLGLDKLIEKAASDIPDARDRLDYVARLSEQSAKRVLDATDTAGPLQDGIETRSAE